MELMVSVCILSYNHSNYIRQTLDSILSQKTDFGIEILIHDDASTDGTDKIISEYADKYPDIVKPLYETENQFSKSDIKNISGIYNFPRAAGKYIAMCEGDDYWTDVNKLQMQVDYMESHPDCTLCFHSANQINVDVVGTALMRPYNCSCDVSPEEIICKKSGYPTASLLMRADIMKKLPDFYMKAPIGDIPMQLTMAAEGYGHYIDKPMCAYRYFAPGSWSREMQSSKDRIAKQQQYLSQMLDMYDSFDEYTGHRFSDSVKKAKDRISFATSLNIRNWKEIFSKDNKEFYKELPVRDKILLRLQSFESKVVKKKN